MGIPWTALIQTVSFPLLSDVEVKVYVHVKQFAVRDDSFVVRIFDHHKAELQM